ELDLVEPVRAVQCPLHERRELRFDPSRRRSLLSPSSGRGRWRGHEMLNVIQQGLIAMKLPQTGGCQCGKIRYEITEAPQLVYTCHCTACQRLTSSAFSMGLVVTETAFRLSGVEPEPLQRVADSGRVNTRLVCPECGSWICGLPRDGVVRVRAGSLDDIMAAADPAHGMPC